eukprot:scaffold117355_cov46-Prasinocladus_malaysianus.AAC.1
MAASEDNPVEDRDMDDQHALSHQPSKNCIDIAGSVVLKQTKELLRFNEVLEYLMKHTEESERARVSNIRTLALQQMTLRCLRGTERLPFVSSQKEYENNNLSIFKAARAAAKQKAFPLEMVEKYVEASKTGLRGLASLEQLLSHTRRQAQ